MPSFGLSFGFVQLDCPRDTWGTWRASSDCIVIAYSLSGSAQLAISGYGDAIAPYAHEQAGCPVPAGQHRFFANRGLHQCYYLACSPGMLETLAAEHSALARLNVIPDDWDTSPWQWYRVADEDFRILESIRTCTRSGMDRHRFLQQRFVALMQRYAERIDRYGDNPDKQHETTFHQAMTFIEENYQNTGLDMAMVADAVSLSLDGLKKIFQRRGSKANSYIVGYRLLRAKELLSETDIPIGDVAYLCGFADRGHFGVLFRQNFLLTPSDYRNKLKNK